MTDLTAPGRFLRASPRRDELMLLLAIHREGAVQMPIDPRRFPEAMFEHVSITRLLDERFLSIQDGSTNRVLVLTPEGESHMRELIIDYHLELMDLRHVSDEMFNQLVRMLEWKGCSTILLYGASDTAKVLLEFLTSSSIRVLAVMDDDIAKHGLSLGGVFVTSPARMCDYEFDSVVVTTVAYQDAILSKAAGIVPAGKRLLGLFDDVWSNSSGKRTQNGVEDV